MRLFLATFCLTALLTSLSAMGQSDEPLTGGSEQRQNARFEVSAAKRYITARAQANAAHRDAIVKYYDMIGYDYAHPTINAGMATFAPAPVRIGRTYPFTGIGMYYESRTNGTYHQ